MTCRSSRRHREQDFRSDFVASVLDGKKIALTNAHPTRKICLRNIEPHRPAPFHALCGLAIPSGFKDIIAIG